jgi:hypothetical protein
MKRLSPIARHTVNVSPMRNSTPLMLISLVAAVLLSALVAAAQEAKGPSEAQFDAKIHAAAQALDSHALSVQQLFPASFR